LDDTIDRSKIEASLEGGVLTLNLHRREAEKPRKITIKPS
jgi:HSP20 family molecular chaperone IbpA